MVGLGVALLITMGSLVVLSGVLLLLHMVERWVSGPEQRGEEEWRRRYQRWRAAAMLSRSPRHRRQTIKPRS